MTTQKPNRTLLNKKVIFKRKIPIIKFFSHKYLISEDILKKLLSYYAFVFLFSFFGFLLLFIKQGKIKVTFSR
jgi:hypothetical protein